MRYRTILAPLIYILVTTVACTDDQLTDAPAATTLTSVVPAGGATGVDPAAPISIRFSHPMSMGMEQYIALHEGDAAGLEVPGTWMWSDDRTSLTYTPDGPLKNHTQYMLHIGGGLRDANGELIDCETTGQMFGGRTFTEQMAAGMGHSHGGTSGQGWRHPTSGTYGMTFTFTTA